MNFDTLYHKGSSGAIYSWRVWTEGADICTEYGQLEGKKQLARKTAEAKNVDKANATTPEEQAILEATSMWTHRVERKYRKTLDEASNDEIFLPMLASEFEKRRGQKKEGHTYPCDVQPKLDGCVYGSTVLTTSDGPKTIQEIVEGRLPVEVLSYNEKSKVFEFKRIINWFNNGYADYTHWLDVVPEFGTHIKCTSDHKFLTPSGWKEARDLDPKQDLILSFDDSSYFNSLLAPVTKGPVWQKFHVRHSKYMPDAAKYDIEVEENHTYVANGHVIHNCRALAYWDGEEVKLLSRGGKDYNCPHIVDVLKNVLPPNLVLDGELYLHGVGFQTITSWVKRLQENTSKIQYHVYDCILLDEREAQWPSRYSYLHDFFGTRHNRLTGVIQLVDTYEAKNDDEVLRVHNHVVSDGYEGAIVRMYDNSEYRFAYRSKRLLKVKSFSDNEYRVVGYTTGKGRFEDCAVWVCQVGDHTFQVVSKGTMEERRKMLEEADSYVGQLLKVKYFELTDEGIPRFPVGVGFRMEEDL